jgi:hypothetical protein
VYALGSLEPGYYSVDVDKHTWDDFVSTFENVGSFEVLNSYGSSIASETSTYSDLDFTVESSSNHYIKITGKAYGSDAQYRVAYTRTGDLEAINSVAIFSDASITGEHVVGQTLTANITYSDANGISGATPTVYWYAGSDGLGYGASNTYTLTENDVGKNIWAAVSFNDDAGNFEASDIFGGSIVFAANSAPTLITTTSLTTDEDTATSAISFTGSDIDGDSLTYSFGSPPKGSVADNGDSTFTYTPDVNANGSDSFTITVNDGTVDVTETVAVTINLVNDLPTGALLYHGKFVENQTLSADVTQINDSDGLGDFTYIWKKDDQVITDENTQYYTLKNDDVASVISAEVTYTDKFGTMETVLGEGISEISPLGDLRSLDFAFLETNDDKLEHRISVELSETFSKADSISLLYWKEGEDQNWVTLTRDQNTDNFINASETNRFLSDGSYAVRAITATDDFGANVRFTEEKMTEIGLNTKFALSNSKSDNNAPEVLSLSFSEFYYDETLELWNLAYSLSARDDVSGLQLGHIIELINPTGSSIQDWRYFDENGQIETTLSFPKYLPSGDYTINTVRVHDKAGNDGWLYSYDLSSYGQHSSITIDNPFGDENPPLLNSFQMTAELNR